MTVIGTGPLDIYCILLCSKRASIFRSAAAAAAAAATAADAALILKIRYILWLVAHTKSVVFVTACWKLSRSMDLILDLIMYY